MAAKDAILGVVRPRNVAGASAAVYTAAEVLHLAHGSPVEIGLASLVASGFTGWKGGSRPAIAVGAAGTWLTLASSAGPWTGAWHPLTIVWGAGAVATLITLNRHSAVKAARAWKKAKERWLHDAPAYGLFGSHLLHHELTRLGERLRVDVTETGKRASSLANSALAEDIAMRRKLPRNRVRVSEAPIAGQIDISIRTQDPWKHAIPHPLLDREPEIALTLPATIREPLILGQDPETGRPLTLALWNADGGRNIYIIGKKGSGKTTLLNCLRERLAACPDALVLGINVSKAIEDLEWAPACHLTAIGDKQGKKALAILRLVHKIIVESGNIRRDDKVIQPTAAWPAVILLIDEIDALTELCGEAAKRELRYISSKNRSESVSLVAAGQRGTADWMGGADVRAQLDVVCAGKVRRQGEITHAIGTMAPQIPDMASYGEGHAGVWAIVEDGGDYDLGRAFNLSELTDIRAIAWERRRPEAELNPVLSDRIGDIYTALRAMQLSEYHGDYLGEAAAALFPPVASQAEGDGQEAPPAGGSTQTLTIPSPEDTLAAMNRELEEFVPDELKDQLSGIRRTLDDAREIFNDNPLPDMSDVSDSDMAAFHDARWRQVGESAVIPEGAREALIRLLGGGGTTTSAAAKALGQSKWTMRTWLERLRMDEVAWVDGRGRAARWKLTTPGEVTDGDDQHDA